MGGIRGRWIHSLEFDVGDSSLSSVSSCDVNQFGLNIDPEHTVPRNQTSQIESDARVSAADVQEVVMRLQMRNQMCGEFFGRSFVEDAPHLVVCIFPFVIVVFLSSMVSKSACYRRSEGKLSPTGQLARGDEKAYMTKFQSEFQEEFRAHKAVVCFRHRQLTRVSLATNTIELLVASLSSWWKTEKQRQTCKQRS